MDKALKQRLVGASVLIILAVIVLPMLLSGRSDTLKQESREIELPPKPEELSFETRRFPIEVANQAPATSGAAVADQDSQDSEAIDTDFGTQSIEGAGLDADGAQPDSPVADREALSSQADAGAAEPAAGASQPSATGAGPEVTEPVVTGNEGPPSKTDTPAPAVPRYLVQVASFSDMNNANKLAEWLRADSLPVAMDVVDRVGGPLHRVRVGPYVYRSDADLLVTHLRSQRKDLNPRVLDLRPDDSSPVATPSDPLVRWVVQVGSFSDRANAENLVAKLRLAGLTAFSEQVISSGDTAYKVRIGPEIERDKAVELARTVKADHGLDGLVMTMD